MEFLKGIFGRKRSQTIGMPEEMSVKQEPQLSTEEMRRKELRKRLDELEALTDNQNNDNCQKFGSSFHY